MKIEAKSRDNYALSRDRAQELFRSYDHDEIVKRWGLRQDGDAICLDFFGSPYRISRTTGQISRQLSGESAGYEEVMTIFDLLSHPGEKTLAGTLAPVNSLRGRPVSAGVETNFFTQAADRFDKDPEGFRRACQALGGEAVAMGDIGYRFVVFDRLQVTVKFYHSDEDFPASLTCLWDHNTLQYLLYETVFYAEGFLLRRIQDRMSEQAEKGERT